MGGQFYQTLGADLVRVENLEINAPGNHRDPVTGHRIIAADMIGDEITDGDDFIARRHDRIILIFNRGRPAGIGAVEGGDIRQAQLAGGRPGTPGRRARAGMDQMRPGAFRQFLQSVHIAPESPQILTGQRQGHVLGADPLQFITQPAAFGRDNGLPPGIHDRARNIHRPAFDPAHIQGRQNLQDHRRPRQGERLRLCAVAICWGRRHR